jgi:hypothetical protein
MTSKFAVTNESFSPAFGNRPDYLVGREPIIRNFIDGLEGAPGNRNRASLYIGQRGMGKTALLLELADCAEDHGFVTAGVMANERMLEEIIQMIQINGEKYVKKDTKGFKSINMGAYGFSFGLEFKEEVKSNYGFRVKLKLLCEALAKCNKGILVLVDEVRATSPEMRELAATYQHLVGEKQNIAIAMAGLPSAISDVLNDDVLTFLNRANKTELGLLPINAVSVYYAGVFQKLGKTICSELLEKTSEATRGYPYLLQLIGYYLLQYTGDAKTVAPEQVDLSIGSAKRELIDNVYLASLKPLSKRDKDFLEAMAESGETSSIADIRARMNASHATAQLYRKRLIASGVIASISYGELGFTIPYIDEYIRQSANKSQK